MRPSARVILTILGLMLTWQAGAQPVQWTADEGGDDRYYEYVLEQVTWVEARKLAAERRHNGLPGRLVVITSQEQNDFLLKIMPRDNHRGWIGLTDEKVEGEFRWVDGTKPIYTNWAPGEPNNTAGIEHYGEMLPTGQWNDKKNDPEPERIPPQGYFVEYFSEHALVRAQPRGEACAAADPEHEV